MLRVFVSSSAALLPPVCLALVGGSRRLLPPPFSYLYFFGLPLLCSPCALAAFAFPAWPLAAPCWLFPPVLCLAVFVAAARCSLLFFFLLRCFSPSCLLDARRRFSPSAAPPPLFFVVALPLLCSQRALTAFVFPRWPLAAPLRLLPPPPPYVSAVFVAAARFSVFFFTADLLLPFCLPLVGGSRRLLPPPPPPPGARLVPRAVPCCRAALPFRRDFFWCCVAVFRAACRAVVLRLAVLWAAARCAVFVGASVCVLCCAVGCCCVLCRVSGRAVRLGWSRCGLLSGFGLRCRVLCCAVCTWVRCCGALLPVVPPGVVRLCAVLFCFARLVPMLVLLCPLALPVALGSCAMRRCVLLCSPALCALCCVYFLVVCWCVLLLAAVLCAVCVLRCCAVRSLSSPLGVVLCCAVLVRLCCAVAAVLCCGALLCVVLFSLVFCGVMLGLMARGCLLVAFLGVCVPVWPRGLLPRVLCGLLWCPASLCRVLWCCAVAWWCAVVLCCRFAVLFVLASPACGLSCSAVLCCVVLLVFCACFLPGVGVCVLWCPFAPCRHAQNILIITLCYAPPVSVSVYHVVDETGLIVRRFFADPGVTAHLLHLFVHVQQTGPHRLLISALFCHVVAACSKGEAEVSRVGHGWEEKVHGEQKRAKGSMCRGVAC